MKAIQLKLIPDENVPKVAVPSIDPPKEVWAAIPDFEGIYEVSDWGRVRRIGRVYKDKLGREIYLPEKFMVPHLTLAGYYQTFLRHKEKTRYCFIHRLVAQMFCDGRTHEKNIVNHKNEIKTDNRAVNLEWCTPQYNANWTKKVVLESSKRTWQKPVEAWKDGALVTRYGSIREAAKATGLMDSDICDACRGNRFRKPGGYEWRYSTRQTWIEVQAWKDGILIKSFYRVSDAIRWAATSGTSIGLCLRGRQKTAGGYVWKKIVKKGELPVEAEQAKERSFTRMRKKVDQFKNGIKIASFESLSEASRKTGIHVAGISISCRKGKPYAGFLFKYASEYLLPQNLVGIQAWKNGDFVREFPSLAAAAEWAGVALECISYASKSRKKNGQERTSGGYVWRRIMEKRR